MHRNATFREYSEHFDSLLPDQDSLLIQLCEHLFKSGFVFVDASENELEAGGWVIRDFFDQEAEVLRTLVPRERYVGFIDYVKQFNWPAEILQKKLSQRIQKSFDQLAKGKHHHFNIRYNISYGLREQEKHPLYDFLLHIETYYSLVLGGETLEQEDQEEEPDFSKTNFKIEDLKQLRSQVRERLEGRELVKGFLKHIAKKRGVSVESLNPVIKQERKNSPIKFLRPSQLNPTAEKRTAPDVAEILIAEEKNDIVDKLDISSTLTEDQNELSEFPLEPDLETDIAETAEVLIESKKSEEGIFEEETVASQTIEDAAVEVEEEELKEKNNYEPETEADSSTVTTADLLLNFEEDEEDEEIEEDDSGLILVDSDETDVVFGGEKISKAALEKFIRQYPDSTLRFLLRRSLDGRPLSAEIEAIYYSWEKRGLSRGRLKKYLLKLMEWPEVPDLPILDLLQSLKDRIYEDSQKVET
ncbi:MAG TPA: hypothetical protein EYO28_08100 [Candidatus Lambdaproteobacteria bacterium]|nr:hypothetical protein [Candidatus Lambdaproteobacteria bacterium]